MRWKITMEQGLVLDGRAVRPHFQSGPVLSRMPGRDASLPHDLDLAAMVPDGFDPLDGNVRAGEVEDMKALEDLLELEAETEPKVGTQAAKSLSRKQKAWNESRRIRTQLNGCLSVPESGEQTITHSLQVPSSALTPETRIVVEAAMEVFFRHTVRVRAEIALGNTYDGMLLDGKGRPVLDAKGVSGSAKRLLMQDLDVQGRWLRGAWQEAQGQIDSRIECLDAEIAWIEETLDTTAKKIKREEMYLRIGKRPRKDKATGQFVWTALSNKDRKETRRLVASRHRRILALTLRLNERKAAKAKPLPPMVLCGRKRMIAKNRLMDEAKALAALLSDTKTTGRARRDAEQRLPVLAREARDLDQEMHLARRGEMLYVGEAAKTGGSGIVSATIAEDGSLSLGLYLPPAAVRLARGRLLRAGLDPKAAVERLVLTDLWFLNDREAKAVRMASVGRGVGKAVGTLPDDALNAVKAKALARHHDVVEAIRRATPALRRDGDAPAGPVAWRLKLRADGSLVVACTCNRPVAYTVRDIHGGWVAVDYNDHFIACVATDGNGNLVGRRSFRWERGRSGRSRDGRRRAVKSAVAWAKGLGKPIAIEQLDFAKKKTAMRDAGPNYARMLSGLDYAAFGQEIHSHAGKQGVYVHEVSPAWTSFAGRVKYATGRKAIASEIPPADAAGGKENVLGSVEIDLTTKQVHHDAALCIGRRAAGHEENLPRTGEDGCVVFVVPWWMRDAKKPAVGKGPSAGAVIVDSVRVVVRMDEVIAAAGNGTDPRGGWKALRKALRQSSDGGSRAVQSAPKDSRTSNSTSGTLTAEVEDGLPDFAAAPGR